MLPPAPSSLAAVKGLAWNGAEGIYMEEGLEDERGQDPGPSSSPLSARAQQVQEGQTQGVYSLPL